MTEAKSGGAMGAKVPLDQGNLWISRVFQGLNKFIKSAKMQRKKLLRRAHPQNQVLGLLKSQ